MNIKIKRAKPEDVKDLQGFVYSLMKYEYKHFDKTTDPKWAKSKPCEKYFKKRVESRNSIALLAFDGEKIVGYLSGGIGKADLWRKMKIHGELADMFVEEKYRNKKVGTLLMEEFLTWAKKRKATTVEVKAYAGNDIATNFYRKHGFEDYIMVFEKKL